MEAQPLGAPSLTERLECVFGQLASSQLAASVAVLQLWLPARQPDNDWLLCSPHSPSLAHVGLSDTAFQAFRDSCCQAQLMFAHSMCSRVWKTGSVQVVQNLRLVPPAMHPRTFLSESALDKLGEAIYIPVYDTLRPGWGPVTVLEALLPSHMAQPIIAADLLSYVALALAGVGLSVSNPLPEPIKRSALSGRRAKATDDSSSDVECEGHQGHGCAPGASTASGRQGQPAEGVDVDRPLPQARGSSSASCVDARACDTLGAAGGGPDRGGLLAAAAAVKALSGPARAGGDQPSVTTASHPRSDASTPGAGPCVETGARARQWGGAGQTGGCVGAEQGRGRWSEQVVDGSCSDDGAEGLPRKMRKLSATVPAGMVRTASVFRFARSAMPGDAAT